MSSIGSTVIGVTSIIVITIMMTLMITTIFPWSIIPFFVSWTMKDQETYFLPGSFSRVHKSQHLHWIEVELADWKSVVITNTYTQKIWCGSLKRMKKKFNSTVTYFSLRMVLTHFIPLVSFYTLWKHQKTFGETSGFLMFSGGIERYHWHEMS